MYNFDTKSIMSDQPLALAIEAPFRYIEKPHNKDKLSKKEEDAIKEKVILLKPLIPWFDKNPRTAMPVVCIPSGVLDKNGDDIEFKVN